MLGAARLCKDVKEVVGRANRMEMSWLWFRDVSADHALCCTKLVVYAPHNDLQASVRTLGRAFEALQVKISPIRTRTNNESLGSRVTKLSLFKSRLVSYTLISKKMYF